MEKDDFLFSPVPSHNVLSRIDIQEKNENLYRNYHVLPYTMFIASYDHRDSK